MFARLFVVMFSFLLALGAMAQNNSLLAFASKSYVSNATGDDIVKFTQRFELDPNINSFPEFDDLQFQFRIDTHFVDLAFKGPGGELKLSSVTGTLQIGFWNWLNTKLLANAYGSITPVSGSAGVYNVLFIARQPASLPFTNISPIANAFTSQDGGPLQAIIHRDAIRQAGGFYQLEPAADVNVSYVRTYDDPFGSIAHLPMKFAGGSFTIIPEPSSIAAILTGLGLLAFRLHHRVV